MNKIVLFLLCVGFAFASAAITPKKRASRRKLPAEGGKLQPAGEREVETLP